MPKLDLLCVFRFGGNHCGRGEGHFDPPFGLIREYKWPFRSRVNEVSLLQRVHSLANCTVSQNLKIIIR